MNNLSWFVYLADISQSLTVFAIIFLVLSTIVFVIFALVYVNEYDADDRKELVERLVALKKGWTIPLILLALFVVVVVPSKQTMYTMAASEMSEEAYKSEQGQKIVQALSSWVEEKIKPDNADQ